MKAPPAELVQQQVLDALRARPLKTETAVCFLK